jgi:hypothetical protein
MFVHTDKITRLYINGIPVKSATVAGLFRQCIGYKVSLLLSEDSGACFDLPISRNKAGELLRRGYRTVVDSNEKTLVVHGSIADY